MKTTIPPAPRKPRRVERVYLPLAIVTFAIGLVATGLGVTRWLLGFQVRPEVFPAALLFAVAGSGLLFLSIRRARR